MSQIIGKLYPLANRVVVKRASGEACSKGGIMLPENSTKTMRGTVVAVGPGHVNNDGDLIPLTVRVGDEVILPEYGGTKLEINKLENLYVFRENDLLAKITE